MYSIRSLDVLSCAKITGVIYGCLALIVVPPLVLWSAFSSLLHGSQGLSSPSSWGSGSCFRRFLPVPLWIDRLFCRGAERVGLQFRRPQNWRHQVRAETRDREPSDVGGH